MSLFWCFNWKAVLSFIGPWLSVRYYVKYLTHTNEFNPDNWEGKFSCPNLKLGRLISKGFHEVQLFKNQSYNLNLILVSSFSFLCLYCNLVLCIFSIMAHWWFESWHEMWVSLRYIIPLLLDIYIDRHLGPSR